MQLLGEETLMATHPRNETFDDLPTRTNLKEKSIHSDGMVIETGTNNTAPCASLFQSLPGERRSFQARGYMPDKQPTPSQPPPFILPLLPSPPPHRTIMWPSRVSTSSATTHTPLSTPHPFHTIPHHPHTIHTIPNASETSLYDRKNSRAPPST